jgi:hypothetical protein
MDRGSLYAIGFLTFILLGGTLAALFASGPTTPAMPQPNGWRVLEPVTYENLSVFPVVTAKGADTSGFVTLDEALASGDAVVSERGGDIIRRTRDGRPMPIQEGGASVNQLVLINRGSKPLMLLAGELISGGKQDRVIAKDRIVAPGAEPLPLDVFCVEHGRWSSGAQFASAKIMVHPSVREKAAVDQKQSEVWAAVQSGTTARSVGGVGAPAAAPQISMDSIATAVATEAPTQSYKGIYQSRRVGASVENFAEELQRRFKRATEGLKGEHVVGVIVAYGGEVAWADIFASPKLFEGYWPKLVRSYVVEALARPQTREQASISDAREFLRPLQGREQVDSEPGIYRWRQVSTGRYAEIELEALKPAPLVLHTLKIHRTGDPTPLTK